MSEIRSGRSASTSDVFRGDRDSLISEFADQEHTLARELAAVRELLHLTLGQLHEQGRRHERLREQHRRLRDECRDLRAAIPRDDWRAA